MVDRLRQMVITVGSPDELGGREGRRVLADFYGELLGMQVVSEGWLRIATDPSSPLSLALDGDGWSDACPPRWRDPEHPQQAHLDLAAADAGPCVRLAISLGATLLEDFADHTVLADPAGHPFCVWPDPSLLAAPPARLRRVTFDCFSPRSLAAFYEGLLCVDDRVEDTADFVTLSLGQADYPALGFQQAEFRSARWPDPAYPAQFHLDLRFDNGPEGAVERAVQLGAIRLPKLADTTILGDPAAHPLCL
jgi:hypothetical protein